MDMKWQTVLILAATLSGLTALSVTAQENNPNNDSPPLKKLMNTSSVVTNSVGMVLVKTSNGLWAGKFGTTQSAYEQIMHSNPSAFPGSQNPVDSVSWNQAMDFCSKLTAKEKGPVAVRLLL